MQKFLLQSLLQIRHEILNLKLLKYLKNIVSILRCKNKEMSIFITRRIYNCCRKLNCNETTVLIFFLCETNQFIAHNTKSFN